MLLPHDKGGVDAMTRSVHRRFLLTGLGHAAAMASLSSILPRQAAAGQQAAAAPLKVCMQMIYPAGEGLTFDADAFRDRHIALLKNSYGPAVERIELRVSPPPPPPPPAVEGQPAPPAPQGAPIMASVSLWLGDIGEFVKRNQASARAIAADMATITRSAPMVQFDTIEGQVGDPASSVIGGSTVLSQFFIAKEGGTWNAEWFGKTYLSRLLEVYGATAIRRAEVAKGAQGIGDAKPLVAGIVNIYIKDVAAFDAVAGNEALKMLEAAALQNSSLTPVNIVMTVHATG
jgi:hypothetical protein